MTNYTKMVVIADLQIFGDVVVGDHISALLRPFVVSSESDHPTTDADAQVMLDSVVINYAATNGPFGLQYAMFSVALWMTNNELKDATDVVHKRLAHMLGYSDVSVRWVEPAIV